MKKQIFAVCDPEADYARNFMEYLNRKKSLPFEVQAFTSVQSLVNFARENPIELLLISAEAVCPEIQELNIGKIVILTEGTRPEELEAYAGVYKYQASSSIVREVMACYGEERTLAESPAPVLKKTTEILGVYSPVGRCLKTSFALALGQILSANRPVLYLNLEEYSGFEELLGKKFPYTLSDLLYYVRQGTANLTVRLNSMVQSIGKLDYIPPVQSSGDIRGALWKDWEALLHEIILHSTYETIVLDIGNGIDEVFQMLDLCSRIFMPVRPDRISECKIRQFESLAKTRDYPQILTKTVKMKLPYQSFTQGSAGWPEQLVWSELGKFTQELVRKEKI